MKTNFGRTNQVLDQMIGTLTGTEIGLIGASAKALKDGYGGNRLIRSDLPPIDYSESATQFAYIYTYMAANADLIYRTLCAASKPIASLLNKTTVNLVAMGGGPGSELIGFFKFLERRALATKTINFTVYDHHPAWAGVWPFVSATAPAGRIVAIHEVPFSWHESDFDMDLRNVGDADIVFMSYTLSEAWRYNHGSVVEARVREVIDAMKPGAAIIYSDNNGQTFEAGLQSSLVSNPALSVIDRTDYDHMMVGSDEESSDVEGHHVVVKARPKLTGKATCVAFLKQ